MGDYHRKQQLANGVVYEYVPRINGLTQGDYSIYAALPSPNKIHTITARARVKINDFEQVYTELAFLDTDMNLFSQIDKEDDKGFAIKTGMVSARKIAWLEDYRVNSQAE